MEIIRSDNGLYDELTGLADELDEGLSEREESKMNPTFLAWAAE